MIDVSPLLLWPEDPSNLSEGVKGAYCGPVANSPRARRLQVLIAEARGAGVGLHTHVAILHDLATVLLHRFRLLGGAENLSQTKALALAIEHARNAISSHDSAGAVEAAEKFCDEITERPDCADSWDTDGDPSAVGAVTLAYRLPWLKESHRVLDPIDAWQDAVRMFGAIAEVTPPNHLESVIDRCAKLVYRRLRAGGAFVARTAPRACRREEAEYANEDNASDPTPSLLWDDHLLEHGDKFTKQNAAELVDSPLARRLQVLIAEAGAAGIKTSVSGRVVLEWAELWASMTPRPGTHFDMVRGFLEAALASPASFTSESANEAIHAIEMDEFRGKSGGRHADNLAVGMKIAAGAALRSVVGEGYRVADFSGWRIAADSLAAIADAAHRSGRDVGDTMKQCAAIAYAALFSEERPPRKARSRQQAARAPEAKAAEATQATHAI